MTDEAWGNELAVRLSVGSLHFDVPGFSQSLQCFGLHARHSEVCGLRILGLHNHY